MYQGNKINPSKIIAKIALYKAISPELSGIYFTNNPIVPNTFRFVLIQKKQNLKLSHR